MNMKTSSYQITFLKSNNFKNINNKQKFEILNHFRSDAPLKTGSKEASNAVNGIYIYHI